MSTYEPACAQCKRLITDMPEGDTLPECCARAVARYCMLRVLHVEWWKTDRLVAEDRDLIAIHVTRLSGNAQVAFSGKKIGVSEDIILKWVAEGSYVMDENETE